MEQLLNKTRPSDSHRSIAHCEEDNRSRARRAEAYRDKALRAARFAGEVVAETLWPTRCALCDAPGQVLCDDCARELPFLDWWRACPRCGSAFGKTQCDLCNPIALARIGIDKLPFAGCSSATMFSEETGRLVRVFKDQGEQRLATILAGYMARYIAPAWNFDAVTFIPASKAAYRYRGFDHCELLAREVAQLMGRKCVRSLDRPVTRDQRVLSGSERIENLKHGFKPFAETTRGASFLLIDDVFTTGSTLCAATKALLGAGAREVFCLTFARV